MSMQSGDIYNDGDTSWVEELSKKKDTEKLQLQEPYVLTSFSVRNQPDTTTTRVYKDLPVHIEGLA